MKPVGSASVTWLGHSTALVGFEGARLLVDPFGRRRCRSIGGYHAVLITHAHHDHLNRWTLSTLDKSADLYVPRGAGRYVDDLGFSSLTEVEPGDSLSPGGVDVAAVPTRHGPGRWRESDGTACVGYVMQRDGIAVHHAGDIDMTTSLEVFERIGREFALDATLLPIGGWLPVSYYRKRQDSFDRGVHIDPDTALEIGLVLGARIMIPIHWGTLHLSLGRSRAARRRLARIAEERNASDLVHFLDHGETLTLHPPR